MGITWFGSVICYNFVIMPSVMGLPLNQRRPIMVQLVKYTPRLLVPAAILVILLGLLRGTVFGPIRSWNYLFGSAYGITWLIAFVVATLTLIEGIRIGRLGERISKEPLPERASDQSKIPTAFAEKMKHFQRMSIVSMLGFLPIFTCMILMRFGY